jgi:Tol biopolymer transport system component
MAGGFSPDGKWAAAIVSNTQLVLLPTTVGATKRIARGNIEHYECTVHWVPDGKRLVFSGSQTSQQTRCFIQDIDGAKPGL